MSESASWGPPYLLYLGNAQDDLAAKTARGLAYWRPAWCVGQVRGPRCKTSVGLPDLDVGQARAAGARTLLVGVANAGGVMDGDTVEAVLAAMEAGLHVASGLHQRLADEPRIREAADRLGRVLFDARRPPALEVGKAVLRAGKRLLTVGTDCSVGKMYTTLAIERELRLRNIAADFRATGQTGIFIAGGHGVPIDAVVADFISGGAEWVSPHATMVAGISSKGRVRSSTRRSLVFRWACCMARSRMRWCSATSPRASTCAACPTTRCLRWRSASPRTCKRRA